MTKNLYPPTEYSVRGKLSFLARLTSTDAIAEWLKKKGYKGRPNNPCECPVANYVGAGWVSVSGVCVTRRAERVGPNEARAPRWTVNTPKKVSQFIARFDNQYYPELVREQRSL